jgi:hypothetical protein
MRNISVLKVLEDFQHVQDRLDPMLYVIALLAALVAAYVAAGLYRFFYESRGTGSQVHRAFPLLSLAITSLFIGVQLSLPLSLGLLGSLSIIRFRTPIKEPEEVGFIMLVIAASISAATFNFGFLVLLYVIAIFSLLVTRGARTWKWLKRSGLLIVTLPDAAAVDSMERLTRLFQEHTGHSRLESSSSRDGATSLQWAFSGLKTDVAVLQAAVRNAGPISSMHVHLDRSGGQR